MGNNLYQSTSLGKIDLNKDEERVEFYNYWCRIVNTRFEKWYEKEHAHSFFELHLCLHGTSKIVFEGREIELKEREYLILSPMQKHQILFESEDFCKFVWGFSIKGQEEFANEVSYCYKANPYLKADEELIEAVNLAIKSSNANNYGSYRLIKDSLFKIFALTLRGLMSVERQVPLKDGKEYFSLVKKYIKENLSNGVTLDQASSFFKISKSKLNQLCLKETGGNFTQLKRKIQIEILRELLENSDKTIEQIAVLGGFSDRYSMSKFFKKYEGINPGQYRFGLNK